MLDVKKTACFCIDADILTVFIICRHFHFESCDVDCVTRFSSFLRMCFRVNELLASFSSAETTQDETVEVSAEPDPVTTEDPSETSDASKPKKKKKKKDKERDQQTDVTYDVNRNRTEVDSDPTSHPKEKKKKKKKDRKQESDAELPSPGADLPGSDSSGYISDKSSRKRKALQNQLLHKDSDLLPAKKKKKMK